MLVNIESLDMLQLQKWIYPKSQWDSGCLVPICGEKNELDQLKHSNLKDVSGLG